MEVPRSARVLGVRVDPVDTAAVEAEIERRVRARMPAAALANVNVHAITIAGKEERFRRFLEAAPMVYCDGTGVRIAARLLGTPLPPCTVMTWWIWDLASWCAKRGFRLFLLGGVQGAAEAAGRRLAEHAPGLRVAGTHHGYFARSGGGSEAVAETINRSGADILIVALGMTLQEYWWEENAAQLTVPVTLFGGAAIDFASGLKQPGPRWLGPSGLSWVYRLMREPRRLWKRYLIGNPLFMIRVVGQLVRGGTDR